MSPSSRKKLFIVCLMVLAALFVLETLLDARVGGGGGYSGRSRGGGGGGDGGNALFYIIWLVIRYPQVGIPVLIIAGFIYYRSRKNNPVPDDLYSNISFAGGAFRLNALERDKLIKKLQEEDPNFSLPLFLDFSQMLYANLVQFAANRELHKARAYVDAAAASRLEGLFKDLTGVRDIIIGECSAANIKLDDPEKNAVTLSFQTNYTIEEESGKDGGIRQTKYYESSNWTLERKKGVVSKGPGEMDRFGCPSCGGALDDSKEGKCSYCGVVFDKGSVTWYLADIQVMELTRKTPEVSGGYAQEVGTFDMTHFQPGLAEHYAAFKETYPDYNEAEFLKRAKHIFSSLQQSWSSQRWELARPFETDHLFRTHLYWITLYKRERVRNVLRDILISRMELVKIQRDAFFDAITLRIHASMIDYMETVEGKHLGGDRKRPRPFSEYWTFIRRAGVKETDKTMDQCPNCGAQLKIGVVGKCEYCGSKITTGEFSWVLSMIEQDESYAG